MPVILQYPALQWQGQVKETKKSLALHNVQTVYVAGNPFPREDIRFR